METEGSHGRETPKPSGDFQEEGRARTSTEYRNIRQGVTFDFHNSSDGRTSPCDEDKVGTPCVDFRSVYDSNSGGGVVIFDFTSSLLFLHFAFHISCLIRVYVFIL